MKAIKKYAIIVAGGSGVRMGTTTPKQFLLLRGKPVLWYTLRTFLQSYDDLKIIVVLPETHIHQGVSIVALLHATTRVTIVTGGATRFHSVKNGLRLVAEDSIIFVHDAVRCLVDVELIHRCGEQAIKKGSAVPAIVATDSIRLADGDNTKVLNRENVFAVQTPQTFKSSILLPAFEQNFSETFTDEAIVVETYGEKIFLINGKYQNIKLTHPIDFWIAEKLLETVAPIA